MAEPSPCGDTSDDTHMETDRAYPGIPRWLNVSGIIVIILVLLVVILLVTGVGGDHGPGRH